MNRDSQIRDPRVDPQPGDVLDNAGDIFGIVRFTVIGRDGCEVHYIDHSAPHEMLSVDLDEWIANSGNDTVIRLAGREVAHG